MEEIQTPSNSEEYYSYAHMNVLVVCDVSNTNSGKVL
jgi:hypothetical protein